MPVRRQFHHGTNLNDLVAIIAHNLVSPGGFGIETMACWYGTPGGHFMSDLSFTVRFELQEVCRDVVGKFSGWFMSGNQDYQKYGAVYAIADAKTLLATRTTKATVWVDDTIVALGVKRTCEVILLPTASMSARKYLMDHNWKKRG